MELDCIVSLINGIKNIKEKTKYNYIARYKILLNDGFNILENEDTIIEKMKEKKYNITQSKNYITSIRSIRTQLNLPIEKLGNYSKSLGIPKGKIPDNLPTKEEIINFIKELYSNSKYREYVINYLIFYYNCRNMDLNLKISTNANLGTDNHLLLQTNKVVFVRNNYKTADIYGSKIDVITDKEFLNACKELLKVESPFRLLNDAKNIGTYIINRTYKKVGESVYMKVNVSDVAKPVIQLAENRGTSIEKVVNYYNV